MKKSAKGFMIASFIMTALAIICFASAPIIAITLSGHPETYTIVTSLVSAINGLSTLLSSLNVFSIVLLALAIVTVIIFVTWLIIIIAKKKPNSIAALIFGLIVMLAFVALFDIMVVTRAYGEGGEQALISFLSVLASNKAKDNDASMFGVLAIAYGALLFGALAFMFAFIEAIIDMCTPGKVKRLYMDLSSRDDNSDLDIESTEDMKDLLNEGLTAEERKRLQAGQSSSGQPLIVQYFNTTGVPMSPAPAQGGSSLTAEDIRSIVRDELSRNNREDLRGIMHHELPCEAPKMPTPIVINTSPAPVPAASAAPVVVTPAPVDTDAIRMIIKEEIRNALDNIPSMDENDIRNLVKGGVQEELANFKPVEVVEQLITVEEKASEPAPAPVAPAPAPEPVVVAPAPEPEPAPAPAPAADPEADKAKIIRIPFETRMGDADDAMKSNYNELKADILAYGVKSRVSNSGDTFRLHTKTYVKITIAGNSLKLYFALDPKKYADSTLPIGDASNKGIYKEIPLVFKVKSGLSLRRAKQLVADVMSQDGLTQKEVVAHDYVQDIKDGKED